MSKNIYLQDEREILKYMYHIIVNPHSRSGLGMKVWETVEKKIISLKLSYRAYFTKYQKHATELAERITDTESPCTLIVLGGDGTINEAINGIKNFESVTVGYIPVGSGNDFARGLGLSKDPLQALDDILNQKKIQIIDIGILRYSDISRYFAVSNGAGFDADICHKAIVSRVKPILNKIKLGKLSYAAIAINRAFFTKPTRITLKIDGERELIFPKSYFAAFMNHRYEGGGVMFCPNAVGNDGKLDYIVVSKIPKILLLFVLVFAFWGTHTKFKCVHTGTMKTAEFSSELPMSFHVDGEPIAPQNRAYISCEPSKLRIITPV